MRAFDIVWNLLYPPKCVSCEDILPYDSTDALCPICSAKFLTEKGYLCPECKLPHAQCGCMPPKLTKTVSKSLHLCEYMKEDSVARDMILDAKDARYEYLYRMLTDELARLLTAELPLYREYVITYVPRSRRKLAEHGIDQAKETVKRLSHRIGIERFAFFGHRHTSEQKHLTAAQRQANTSDAYYLLKRHEAFVRGKKIILYDDVITTGATLLACAKLLKEAGAKEVVIMTFGKTYLAEGKNKTPII